MMVEVEVHACCVFYFALYMLYVSSDTHRMHMLF